MLIYFFSMEGCNPANLRWYYLIEDVVDDEHDEQMKFKLKQCQKSLCKYPLVINNVDHCGLLRHVDENVMKKIKRRLDLERRRTNDIMLHSSMISMSIFSILRDSSAFLSALRDFANSLVSTAILRHR